MIAHHYSARLPFPVDFYDFPCAASIVDTTHDELVTIFGEPAAPIHNDDPGLIERWAFEYECGLRLVFQLDVDHQRTFVIPDIPEIAHVARHLPFAPFRVNLASDTEIAKQMFTAVKLWPDREKEFDVLKVAQVWRQGDDGNQIPIGRPTSQRDAQCHVSDLENRGHKQLYWYTT